MIIIIKVVGKTNPFMITLARTDKPFAIDGFLKIEDKICRVISSECYSKYALKSLPKDIYLDVSEFITSEENVFICNAKIETPNNAPILSLANVTSPSFEEMKDMLMTATLENSFQIGEILGTTEYPVPEEYKGICLLRKGSELVPQTGMPTLINYKDFSENPHIGLFGGSGSGKTVCLKVIIEECMKKNIPMIVPDPHYEMNFSSMRADIPSKYHYDFNKKFKIFTIGDNLGIKFEDIETEELIMLLETSGELSGPMISLVRALHTEGETLTFLKTKIELLTSLKEASESGNLNIAKESQRNQRLWELYKQSIPGASTLTAISWRLSSLDSLKIFEKDMFFINKAIKEKKTCVIRGNIKTLNVVTAHIISKFYNKRKNYVDSTERSITTDFFPPFIIAMDEAHIFCPKGQVTTPMKSMLKTVSQEGRKYGVFQIMATQRPSLLDETIVAQMSTKFVFKLGIREDLITIEKETDLTKEEIYRLPYLKTGFAFISSTLFSKTISSQIRTNITRAKSKLNPFDELEQSIDVVSNDEDYILSLLPLTTTKIAKRMDTISANLATLKSVTDVICLLEDMVSTHRIKKISEGFEDEYVILE